MAENNAITVEAKGEFVLVTLGFAHMDDQNAQTMLADVSAAVDGSPLLPVVLDMGPVQTLPSLSIGALVTLSKKFRKEGRRLVLASVGPKVREVLAVCRLDTLFEFCDNVADAQHRLRQSAGDAD